MSDRDQFITSVFDSLLKTGADNEIVDGVLAACTGPDAMAAWAGGAAPAQPTTSESTAAVDSRGVFLTSLTVEGFRDIGPASTLAFTPGLGLHVVIGRNGCGKRSFAEAFEVLLTGGGRRLDVRTKAWKDGWRNLHHGDPCSVTATVDLEGARHATTLADGHTRAPLLRGEGQAHRRRVEPLRCGGA